MQNALRLIHLGGNRWTSICFLIEMNRSLTNLHTISYRESMFSRATLLVCTVFCLYWVTSGFAAGFAEDAPAPPKGSWILLEINGDKVEGGSPTIEFSDKGIVGFTGVNRFFGNYSQGGDKLFDERIGATRRAGPPERMKLEADYLKALQAVTKHRTAEGQLILEDDNETKLIFDPKPEEKQE